MTTRKNIASSQNLENQPKFRDQLYDEMRLKTLMQNLRRLNSFFHKSTAEGQHEHKELSPDEVEAAKKLKDQIRLQLAELLSEGIPREKLEKVVMECCTPTIQFLSKD
ncbi:MAG: hypothetical protein QXN37_03845 [Candidatus Anstonellaceae archaeon]